MIQAAIDELRKRFLAEEAPVARGVTAEQMLAAPEGAVFVWKNESLSYPMALAKQLGRVDLVVVGPSWLDGAGWKGTLVLSGVVLDHALALTESQKRSLSGLLVRTRERGETIKIMQTPERQGLTPYLAVRDVVEQAAHAWDRAWAVLETGAVASDLANETASKYAGLARKHQALISALISDASGAMERCVDAGLGQEAREWIDALDEMRRVSDAVGVAVRLANGNSSDPWHPRRLEGMKKAGHDAK